MLAGLKHGAPRWLVEALGQTWTDGCYYDLRDFSGFDHVRTYKKRVVISQPYEADGELGKVLVKLTERGVRVRVWGISPYFPGRTFSIVIWREEDTHLAREIMEKMHGPFPRVGNIHPSHHQWT